MEAELETHNTALIPCCTSRNTFSALCLLFWYSTLWYVCLIFLGNINNGYYFCCIWLLIVLICISFLFHSYYFILLDPSIPLPCLVRQAHVLWGLLQCIWNIIQWCGLCLDWVHFPKYQYQFNIYKLILCCLGSTQRTVYSSIRCMNCQLENSQCTSFQSQHFDVLTILTAFSTVLFVLIVIEMPYVLKLSIVIRKVWISEHGNSLFCFLQFFRTSFLFAYLKDTFMIWRTLLWFVSVLVLSIRARLLGNGISKSEVIFDAEMVAFHKLKGQFRYF